MIVVSLSLHVDKGNILCFFQVTVVPHQCEKDHWSPCQRLIPLVQSAVNLLDEAVVRKTDFLQDVFSRSFFCKQEAQPPVFITAEEEHFFTDGSSKTSAFFIFCPVVLLCVSL